MLQGERRRGLAFTCGAELRALISLIVDTMMSFKVLGAWRDPKVMMNQSRSDHCGAGSILVGRQQHRPDLRPEVGVRLEAVVPVVWAPGT